MQYRVSVHIQMTAFHFRLLIANLLSINCSSSPVDVQRKHTTFFRLFVRINVNMLRPRCYEPISGMLTRCFRLQSKFILFPILTIITKQKEDIFSDYHLLNYWFDKRFVLSHSSFHSIPYSLFSSPLRLLIVRLREIMI